MCRATFLLFSLLLCPPFCSAWSGTVIRVTDGDTLAVQATEGQQVRIRLYGIDCPEGGQPYGREATEVTRFLSLGRQVEIEELGQDRYRGAIAIVRLPDGMTIQERLLMKGAAWVFPRYCTRPECETWRELERAARAADVGLWRASEPIPPWEWRSSARNAQKPRGGY